MLKWHCFVVINIIHTYESLLHLNNKWLTNILHKDILLREQFFADLMHDIPYYGAFALVGLLGMCPVRPSDCLENEKNLKSRILVWRLPVSWLTTGFEVKGQEHEPHSAQDSVL